MRSCMALADHDLRTCAPPVCMCLCMCCVCVCVFPAPFPFSSCVKLCSLVVSAMRTSVLLEKTHQGFTYEFFHGPARTSGLAETHPGGNTDSDMKGVVKDITYGDLWSKKNAERKHGELSHLLEPRRVRREQPFWLRGRCRDLPARMRDAGTAHGTANSH